ncbi:hypothetical protein QBD01_001726 [Ochrobactrum sp. 19YEA23]|nr:hypothetical protein [Ochrobactrum sp. 19YEA23]
MLSGWTDVDRGDVAEDHISDTGISSFTRYCRMTGNGQVGHHANHRGP